MVATGAWSSAGRLTGSPPHVRATVIMNARRPANDRHRCGAPTNESHDRITRDLTRPDTAVLLEAVHAGWARWVLTRPPDPATCIRIVFARCCGRLGRRARIVGVPEVGTRHVVVVTGVAACRGRRVVVVAAIAGRRGVQRVESGIAGRRRTELGAATRRPDHKRRDEPPSAAHDRLKLRSIHALSLRHVARGAKMRPVAAATTELTPQNAKRPGSELPDRLWGGGKGDRTLDLRAASATLSQLSYAPVGTPAVGQGPPYLAAAGGVVKHRRADCDDRDPTTRSRASPPTKGSERRRVAGSTGRVTVSPTARASAHRDGRSLPCANARRIMSSPRRLP